MSEDNNKILDHDYDGIKEMDNPLPNWWLTTFFGTIIFAFLYYIHYTFGGGLTLQEELKIAMSELPKSIDRVLTEDQLKDLMEKPGAVQSGKAVFAARCAACHGAEGQGGIGPNLADEYWIHGKGTRVDIVGLVQKGVPDKGMPTWSSMISENEIYQVSGYVFSLKGTHPANPKAPQGEKAN
jgi:cytochrome c oxidase cbb3-type subunit 3